VEQARPCRSATDRLSRSRTVVPVVSISSTDPTLAFEHFGNSAGNSIWHAMSKLGTMSTNGMKSLRFAHSHLWPSAVAPFSISELVYLSIKLTLGAAESEKRASMVLDLEARSPWWSKSYGNGDRTAY
jgi:hypothetical protein